MSEVNHTNGDFWFTHRKVEILDGPFIGFEAEIYQVIPEMKKVWVKVNFWGKDTPVELNFDQIKPLE